MFFMVEEELRAYLFRTHQDDSWWVSVDDEVSDVTVPLITAVGYKRRNPEKRVVILNAGVKDRDPEWFEVELSATLMDFEG